MGFASLSRTALGAATLLWVGLSLAHGSGFPSPDPKGFAAWRADFRARAIQSGLSAKAVDAILGGTKFLPDVIAADRFQPEGRQPLADYFAEEDTSQTIADGRAAYTRNRSVFEAVAAKYDVDAWPIVGHLGEREPLRKTRAAISHRLVTGDDVLRSAPPRLLRERTPLLHQDGGDGRPQSSGDDWLMAGAVGQPQFEPSDFLDYAVDFNGDGQKDIWSTDADVIGSVANFLHRHGWHKGLPWGSEVKAAPDFVASHNLGRTVKTACKFADQLSERRAVDEWRKLGVGGIDPKLAGDLETSFLSFKLAGGRQFLVSRNFETILTYNCSLHYALTASFVSDQVLAK